MKLFSKVENRCLSVKKWKTVIMRWKPMPWKHFQHIIIISFKNDVEKYFSQAFFYMCAKWRNLLRKFRAKNTIFFKKLKSMSKHLKNSFWQMKPASYWYFWTSFHYGVSGFERRNPSKIRCGEISKIWGPLKNMLWIDQLIKAP